MIYGYGIVDKDGKPLTNADGIPRLWPELLDLVKEVDEINSIYSRGVSVRNTPYTVVALTFRCKNGKFI